MPMNNMREALEDIEFLTRSKHRVIVLAALARRPQSRADLRAMTGVSRSTIGRTLREFEDRRWVVKDGDQFEASQLGAYFAAAMADLIDRAETEQTLRDVWQWLPDKDSGFTIEMCADATVTVADADNPYRPVNRFLALARETDSYRFVGCDVGLIEPCKTEFKQLILDGMQTEVIDSPGLVQYMRSTDPELFAEAFESGNFTLRVHDDLPAYGVGLLDDRTVISGYDVESGTVRVLIDTDASAARAWAESVYETYRNELPTLSLEPPLA